MEPRHSTIKASSLIELEEVIEGDHVQTTDYYFDKIGEPVPVKLHDSIFDPQSPPSQPLAVSEHFRLVFVAHLSGFCVARTEDVIASAKKIKDSGSGSSVQDLSIVDVPVGKVHILALSTDNSTLAAAVADEVYFFSVPSLLDKEPKPSSSCSLDDSSCIMDFKWARKLESSYLILSKHGHLYQGSSDGPLKNVMHEVDAVEWSVKGKFVAVAKKDTLSIFSCKFKERLSMSLLLNSGNGDSDSSFIVKVDCIKWVRADCIILGCFQVTTIGNEENYVVQVIRSTDGKIIDASSNRVMLSFHDIHPGFTPDILPVESGPCLFLSYLDKCKLAIVANRNNTDDHISMLGWLIEDENEVAVIDIERDTSLPRIDLQENGDDNLVMGLCIDRVSLPDKVIVQTGVEQMREVSPYCILLCLTLEGKLIMFHFSGVNETEAPSEVVSACDDEEDVSLVTTNYDQSELSSESIKQYEEVAVCSKMQDPDKVAICSQIPAIEPSTNGDSTVSKINGSAMFISENNIKSQKMDPCFGSQPLKSSFFEKSSNEIGGFGKSVETFTGFGSSAVASVPSADASSQSFHEPKESMKSLVVPAGLLGSSELSSDRALLVNKTDPSSIIPPISLQNSKHETFGGAAQAFTGIYEKPFHMKDGAVTGTQNGRQVATVTGKIEPLPMIRNSQISLQESFSWGKSSTGKHDLADRNYSNSSLASSTSLEQSFVKQFTNIKDMSKELDMLLKYIEEPGGFWDACTSFQKSSIEALELGLRSLSDQCQLWRCIMNERAQEIQDLFDKTVQVLAKKVYIEGIVKQASDRQYWELWDRQKLSSELEMKRQHILEMNQDLTNQLIELERHFNGLELNKFGGIGESQVSERALQSKFGSLRHNHSFHSLNNIMGSQLAAAQLLSECLSKQMAALNIESPSAKRQSVTKELFETIGITYDTSFCSPNVDKVTCRTSSKKLVLSADSFTSKDTSRRKQQSGMKNYETETGRRRRDSLDRNLGSFDPPKTTVKRMVLQGSQKAIERVSLLEQKQFSSRLPEQTAVGRLEGSENPATPFKRASIPPSNESKPKSQAVQRNFVTAFSPRPVYEKPREMQSKSNSEAYNADLETSPAEVTDTVKPSSFDFFLRTTDGPAQKININLDQRSPISTALPTQVPSLKKSADTLNLNSKKTVEEKKTTGTAQFDFTSKPEPVPVGTTSSPARSFYRTSNTEEKTPPAKISVSAPEPPLPFVNSLFTSSSAPTLFSGISVCKPPPSSVADVDSSKALSTSTQLSFFSPPASVSGSPFHAPKMVSPSPSLPSLNTTFESSKKEPSILNPVADIEKPAPSSHANPLDQMPQPSAKAADKSHVEPTSGSQTSSKDVDSRAVNVTVGVQQEHHSAASAPFSSINAITSKSATNDKNGTPDNLITQDDSMDEEAPEMNSSIEFGLSTLGGFGNNTPPMSSAPKPNPFGGSFGNVNVSSMNTSFAMPERSGELFRPASFSFQSPMAPQASQPLNLVGSFGSGITQAPSQGAFGQPAQIGSGQQALGNVLGAFGQSRQLGPSLPGASSGSPGGFSGGFSNIKPAGPGSGGGGFAGVGTAGGAGGFAGIASGGGGGFGGVASGGGGGGFGGAASGGGGGFGGVASGSGGFGGIASGGGGGFGGVGVGSGGGFGGVASGGGVGFGGAAPGGGGALLSTGGFAGAAGGFGAFNNQQGSGGAAAAAAGATGKPPELFTQMRK